LRAVNVYVVEGPDGLSLIDSGMTFADSRDRLAAGLGALGFALADVKSLHVTHVHRDHYTQAVELRRLFGSRVSLGSEEAESLEVLRNPASVAYAKQLSELERHGAVELAATLRGELANDGLPATAWELPDRWLTAGDTVAVNGTSLEVHPTPGHTHGHVIYLARERSVMFSGDHILPHITPSVGLEPVPGAHPLADYLRSLRYVRQLPDCRVLPAHGAPVDSSYARIDELLAHHDERLRFTAEPLATGEKTSYQVAGALRWTSRLHPFENLAPFHQMIAVLETSFHLDLLVAQGVADGREDAGTAIYTLAG
jgi:glyoxylase-like metal-dependent hydrolase (beta-lactamase superfamily II)